MPFSQIILDWSGTLCNDLPPVIETINRMLLHYGEETISEEEFRRDFQLPFVGFYRDRVPHASADELEDLFRKLFVQSAQAVQPIPHATEFVEARHREGCRLVILSAATDRHFHAQAALLGLDRFFEKTYLGVRDKTQVIDALIDERGFQREETCFIGDMVHDIVAAKQAGVTSIAVLTGYDSAGKLEPAQPDLIVRNLQVLDFLYRRSAKISL